MYQSIFLPAIWPKAWHTPTQTQTQTHHIHMCEYRCEQWTERQWSRFMCAWNLYDNWISVIARILNTFAYDVPRLFPRTLRSHCTLYDTCDWMWMRVVLRCSTPSLAMMILRLLLFAYFTHSQWPLNHSLSCEYVCVYLCINKKNTYAYSCETISLDCVHFAFMQMQTTETICWCWWQ